jgi:hypothetical protein
MGKLERLDRSQEDLMYIAEVRIAAADDFGALLRDMRLWLDENRLEPSRFTYSDLYPGMSIQVTFKVREEAEAFAQRFDGSSTGPVEPWPATADDCTKPRRNGRNPKWQAPAVIS